MQMGFAVVSSKFPLEVDKRNSSKAQLSPNILSLVLIVFMIV
jgi:hypothetical protein